MTNMSDMNMSDIKYPHIEASQAAALFFRQRDLDQPQATALIADILTGCDDGELFLEQCQTESLALDRGHLKSAGFDIRCGFGLRAVYGDATGYAHATEISKAAIDRAGQTIRAVRGNYSGALAPSPPAAQRQLYTNIDPSTEASFAEKAALLSDIDSYARSRDPRVQQVTASLSCSWQVVLILRPDGRAAADMRPLTRLNVAITVRGRDGVMETGSYGGGGRSQLGHLLALDYWQHSVDEALRQALVKIEAIAAPAGEMTVVLGPGWPGILLHEAVGHGLEGDFNRKKTSVFAGLMGQRVAAKGVTVIDNGSLPDQRGSLTIDDEGTPSHQTVLIEDGVLVGYMQDRLNARLSGVAPTGNGRRQSYAHCPMPRMTNTYMLAGDRHSADIIAATPKGIYATSFGGGSVDITSGKFVFSASEAYMIENGKIGPPVKGATLIGNGADALTKIKAIGNDLAFDQGIGTCGKEGQYVPVGVGLPTVRIDGLTVGGTQG